MRAYFPTLVLPLVIVAASFAACGGDNATGSSSTSSGAGGGGGSPPIPSPFGLDTRPMNPTCIAPARPSSTPVSVRFDPAFPGLTFNAPLGITQIPGDPSRFFVFQRGGTV